MKLKKIVAMLLALAMVFSMAGCFGEPQLQDSSHTDPVLGGNPVSQTDPTTAPTEAVTVPMEPETEPVTEPVTEPTVPATFPTEPLDEEGLENLDEILDVLDPEGEVEQEEIQDLTEEEIGGMIEDLLQSGSGGEGSDEETGTEVAPDPGAYDENGAMTQPFDQVYPEAVEGGLVAYDENTLLIKMRNSQGGVVTDAMAAVGVAALEAIVPMEEYTWYEVKLMVGTDATAALEALRQMPEVVLAEYNYKVETAAVTDSEKYAGNELIADQWYLDSCGIPEGMEAMSTNGGSSNVIVAVIDTGVDYDHVDLAQNIWINTGEIPDNGFDDDGNGYVDDYYGVNIVSGTGNGDDDNGHGTHVAGIIAAADNNLGTLGIAYNVKIMPIKAASASGYFNQSDIAKAIFYAYEHGAEVINMSFGGSACSIAVQDALAVAYTRCVLVASAGNDGMHNELYQYALPNYPAALTYVLGVMSVDQYGRESVFTNWDVVAFSNVEYELYAPGDSIMSTLPNDSYGILSGTSMAAPVVSAMAAILRSEFTDRDKYPTKFIYGQLSATSDVTASCVNHDIHNVPKIVNLYAALTKMPKPEVNMQDAALFDTQGLANDTAGVNNGDGVIDAGETIALGLTLRNRWGMSENTVVTIDTLSFAGVADPYITIHNPSVDYGSVGTYSTQDCGRIYTDEIITGWENPFYITVSEDCPNDYIFRINVTITCQNALDSGDTETYVTTAEIELSVRNGYILPNVIDEDMVLTADNLYIIPSGTIITAGTTVRVEPGTHIQFWSDDPEDPYADNYIAYLRVDGNFFVEGTKENPVYIYPSELMSSYNVEFGTGNSGGIVALEYADVTNFSQSNNNNTQGITYAYGCTFRQNYTFMRQRYLNEGIVRDEVLWQLYQKIGKMENCAFYKTSLEGYDATIVGTADKCIFVETTYDFDNLIVRNSVFLINNNLTYVNDRDWGQKNASYEAINEIYTLFDKTGGDTYTQTKIVYRPETGTTYVMIYSGYAPATIDYIRELGGDYAVLETQDEAAWLQDNLPSEVTHQNTGNVICFYQFGITYDYLRDIWVWADGTPVETLEVPATLPLSASVLYYEGNLSHTMQHPGHMDAAGNVQCYVYHESYAVMEIPGLVYVTDIQFQDYEVLMDMESEYLIGAITQPVPMPAESLIFESMDPSVVTVDENGCVTPVGYGTADIYVYSQDRGVYNHITFTVKDYVALEAVTPEAEYAEVAIGETWQLSWNYAPANTTRRNLSFVSSDESVATVDSYGNITGVSSGTAVITAVSAEVDAGGYPITASVTVTVYRPADSLALNESIVVLRLEDGTAALPQAVYTQGAEPVLSWRVLDETMAAVEDGALVLKKEGSTTLEVRDLRTGLTATCTVLVLEEELPEIRKVLSVYQDRYFALAEDGRVFCWTPNQASNKVPQCFRENVQDFAVSDSYLYLLTEDGNLERWIWWNGFRCEETYAVPDVGDIAGIAVWNYDNIYIWCEDGSLYVRGTENTQGQLGLGHTNAVYEFTKVDLPNVASVAIGHNYDAYFLTLDGCLYVAGTAATYKTPMIVDYDVAELYNSDNYNTNIVYADGTIAEAENGQVRKYSIVSMEEVAWAGNHGLGLRDGQVYYLVNIGDGRLQEERIAGISNVKAVYANYGAMYVQTEDNLFYEVSPYSDVKIKLLPLGWLEYDSLNLLESNVEEGILRDDALVLYFNRVLNRAGVKLYADGTQVACTQEIRNLNELVIAPVKGFQPGVTYTVTLEKDSVYDADGLTNEERITFTFTVAESQAGEQGEPETGTAIVVHETVRDEAVERFYWTAEAVEERILELHEQLNWNYRFLGNAILNQISTDFEVTHWLRVLGTANATSVAFGGNYWGTTNEQAIGLQIIDYSDFPNYAQVLYAPYLTEAPENTFPFVTGITVFNKDGDAVTRVGNEEITVRVTFNRDMDTSIPLTVRFGSAYPYGDYEIPGEYVDARTWEGTYTLNTLIENGYQYFSVSNGRTADGELELFTDYFRFLFEIDTTAAQALIMQGHAEDTGIQLSWTQDDFDTLMGYNVYRSTSEDGYYQRVNQTVIPADTREFFDDTVEPGVVYYYNFTVVKTDLTESAPSGKISIMSKDTMAPNVYHSPVYLATMGSNLIISATVTDNLEIASAYVYYRTAGQTGWKIAVMNKLNDKYSAIIPASDLSVEGLEYYIEAFDGVSYTYKGSSEAPYRVTVQEAVGAESLGDVNGDGRISNLDALMLLQAINDLLNLDAEQFARADLNGDGELTAAEALRILQYVSGTVGDLIMP